MFGERIERWLWHEDRIALLLFVSFGVLYLFPAIITGGYFAPIDIVFSFRGYAQAFNPLLGDVSLQFIPWFKLARELLMGGSFPFWNIYSGGGLPLYANLSSAIFFPITWLFLILDVRIALLAAPLLKISITGYCTYLYLKEVGLRWTVSVIAGLAFSFSGFMIVWMQFGVTGMLFYLPFALFLVERFFRRLDYRYLLSLSLLSAVVFFCGHIETMFHLSLVISIYFLFTLINYRSNFYGKFLLFVQFFAAGVLSLLLVAVQLLPFLEYLSRSVKLEDRLSNMDSLVLPKAYILLNAIPDLFGHPVFMNFGNVFGIYNYNETASGYVGSAFLVLAIAGVVTLRKMQLVRFWALVCIACLLFTYDFGYVTQVLNGLPMFDVAKNSRLLFVYAFGVIVLGAFFLEYYLSERQRSSRIIYGSACFIATVILLLYVTFVRAYGSTFGIPQHEYLVYSALFVLMFLIATVIGVYAIHRSRESVGIFVLLLFIFLETGVHGMLYNPVSLSDYPHDGFTKYLSESFSQDYSPSFFFERVLPPNIGTYYHFGQLSEYDALGLRQYERYKRLVGDYHKNWQVFTGPIRLDVLQFLGVSRLVFPRDYGEELYRRNADFLRIIYRDNDVIIFDQEALPRAYLLPTAESHERDSIIMDLLHAQDRDRIRTVERFALNQDGSSLTRYQATTTSYLILNENYYPGWHALLDGSRNLQIEDAQGFKALKVPPGTHEVSVWYLPSSFLVGFAISIVSFALWSILMLLAHFRQMGILVMKRGIPRHDNLQESRNEKTD